MALTLLSVPTQRSWAQANDETTQAADLGRLEWPIAPILIGAIATLLLLALIAKMLDLRLKRDGEVIAVKGVMSDALRGDPELFDLPLTMTVRVPLWRGSPVTIRVYGEVPSSDIRLTALRRVKRAAQRELSVRTRIKSRIGVAPDDSSAGAHSPISEKRDRVDRRTGRMLKPSPRDGRFPV